MKGFILLLLYLTAFELPVFCRKSLPLARLPFYFFQEDQSFKMLETSDYCY